MKVFVPYHDALLDELTPNDRLVPYQVAWRDYLLSRYHACDSGPLSPASGPGDRPGPAATHAPGRR